MKPINKKILKRALGEFIIAFSAKGQLSIKKNGDIKCPIIPIPGMEDDIHELTPEINTAIDRLVEILTS